MPDIEKKTPKVPTPFRVDKETAIKFRETAKEFASI